MSSESSFTVSAADCANSVRRMALAESAEAWLGSCAVSPLLAALTRCWRGDTYDFMAFSDGVTGSCRGGDVCTGGLGVSTWTGEEGVGVVQLAILELKGLNGSD